MTFKAFQTRAVVVTSLALLLLSCATSPSLTNNSSEDTADYWYCAPGDNRSWRCAEDKQALGLSYYRAWKTTLDPVAEALEAESIEEDITVQEESEPVSEELSQEEPASEDKVLVKGVSLKELEEAVETDALYSKVLQLAAYNSQEQAQSFAQSVEQTLSEKPSVIQTRVNGQLYYTVVYYRLASSAEAEQLMQQVKQFFTGINPWLRSRSGFEALRVD